MGRTAAAALGVVVFLVGLSGLALALPLVLPLQLRVADSVDYALLTPNPGGDEWVAGSAGHRFALRTNLGAVWVEASPAELALDYPARRTEPVCAAAADPTEEPTEETAPAEGGLLADGDSLTLLPCQPVTATLNLLTPDRQPLNAYRLPILAPTPTPTGTPAPTPTPTPLPLACAVSGLEVAAQSASAITLSWDLFAAACPAVLRLLLHRSYPDASGSGRVVNTEIISWGGEYHHTDTGLAPCTRYDYTLQAVSAGGPGSASDLGFATTESGDSGSACE